jgi:hypothetical protein
MKESYSEDLASHTGLELYAGGGNATGVATTEVHAGELLSSEITLFVRRPCLCSGKTTRSVAFLARNRAARRSRRTSACMETSSARTGRPYRFPLGTSGNELAQRNGQRTSPTVMLV